MSRRDTIIVAVLVNAGLLIVLFASALKSNTSGADFAAQPIPIIQEHVEPTLKKESSGVIGDEVDQALSHFASQSSTQPFSSTPVQMMPSTPNVAEPTSTSESRFAEDLKSIAQPESSAPSIAAQIITVPEQLQNRSNAEFIEIKVKKGDMLEKLARHHHTTVAEIMKANKLTSSNLRIGQVLKIPNKVIKKAETNTIAHSPSIQPASEPANSNSQGSFYTVKKGDSPWTIAVKNHLKVEDLLKLNNMNEDQARRLKPGDQIRIK